MSKKLIVLLGPTASGKTSFSVELAKWITACHPERSRRATRHVPWFDYAHHDTLPIEIINADSRQIYKYMDIGTAKISREEMQGVPHHLLSVLDPKDDLNIAWYKEYATRAIEDIHSRGNTPMLVGGSMLYISVIIDGLEPILRRGGLPSTAKSPCPYDLSIIGMSIPRDEIRRRINERTHTLLESGWIEEVRELLNRGYTVNDPGFKSHGYREIANKIKNEKCKMNNDLYEEIAAKTRQYAKRQMTWWRHDKRIRWINPDAPAQSLLEDLRVFCESSPRHEHTHSPVL